MKKIPLRDRRGRVRTYTLVDDEDYEWLSQWRWHHIPASNGRGNGYAARSVNYWDENHVHKCRHVYMHLQILGLDKSKTPGAQGEHKNRNSLDNRRTNLRVAPRGQLDNNQNKSMRVDNKSGYRGVHWLENHKKWVARVTIDKIRYRLGLYNSVEEAAVAVADFRANNMPFSEEYDELHK